MARNRRVGMMSGLWRGKNIGRTMRRKAMSVRKSEEVNPMTRDPSVLCI
jgi:hypothetical protein